MSEIKRITSIHEIEGAEFYDYPDWYYDTKQICIDNRICLKCGQPIPNNDKRRRYCSEECSRAWRNWAGIMSLTVTSLRAEVHRKFEFACTECGEMFFSEHESGVKVPRFWGHVHHIIPLKDGGLDVFNNLTLVCRDCHKDIHRRDGKRKV